ncbi:MAG: helix-turn-helix transcriptional regulator [Pseudomonadota bacterium]
MSKLIRQKTSPSRQDFGLWAVLAKHHGAGAVLPRHQHRTGQLVFALEGVMLVETNAARWTVPPQRALWLPPEQPHAIQVLSAVELRTLYCQPALLAQCPAFVQADTVHAVVASPLIRELVLGLFDPRFELPTRALMVRLLLHTLQQTLALPTLLPMPHSEGLRRAVGEWLAQRQWHAPLSDLASSAAMSERSFSRHFSAEVGLSWRAWRQQARLIASIDLLWRGLPVKVVAHQLAFANAAAYIAAFRGLMGATPSSFQKDR